MGKTALLVLVVTITMITMINHCKGKPNFACTERGGYCSDSDTCPSLGGNVEKLSVRCKCGKACCKCTDTCPVGSTCMSEGETCDGTKDTNDCCGNRFCCTPTPITTPKPLVYLADLFRFKANTVAIPGLAINNDSRVTGGELFERVINDDFVLTEKASVMFMRQICDGVSFMHSRHILHLDMKPENILCLSRQGNRIKIIDFGLARKYNPKSELKILFGTPEFMAPEVVNFDPVYPSTDMWSIGVICYILLSGLSPFQGTTEPETLCNITTAKWDFSAEEFECISSDAKDFISNLLIKDPSKRMSCRECLDHQAPFAVIAVIFQKQIQRATKAVQRTLSTKRLRKFVYRRKWQRAVNAMLALKRMGVDLV
ncbi:MYLK [Mytilus edulis]|uniref:MYLK n=2 Tax=Mytilus TaxID=6548 RepID=A0A8S3RFR7_MYTED|nr:MYLK [Mytilus edulis]